jgi:hypothetical protein
LRGPRLSGALPPPLPPEASPKAISGRTSYNPARLEFHHEPQLIRRLFNEGRFGPPQGFTPASSWPWLDRRVSGLRQRTRALFGLAFASGPPLRLTLARRRNSQAHSSIGTPSAVDGLWLLAGIRFQDLFHPPLGVLFTFPSRYWFAIGHRGVFSLAGWSPRLQAGFHVPRLTLVPAPQPSSAVRGHRPLWPGFPACSSARRLSAYAGPEPLLAQVWALPLSLAATDGIEFSFFSSG